MSEIKETFDSLDSIEIDFESIESESHIDLLVEYKRLYHFLIKERDNYHGFIQNDTTDISCNVSHCSCESIRRNYKEYMECLNRIDCKEKELKLRYCETWGEKSDESRCEGCLYYSQCFEDIEKLKSKCLKNPDLKNASALDELCNHCGGTASNTFDTYKEDLVPYIRDFFSEHIIIPTKTFRSFFDTKLHPFLIQQKECKPLIAQYKEFCFIIDDNFEDFLNEFPKEIEFRELEHIKDRFDETVLLYQYKLLIVFKKIYVQAIEEFTAAGKKEKAKLTQQSQLELEEENKVLKSQLDLLTEENNKSKTIVSKLLKENENLKSQLKSTKETIKKIVLRTRAGTNENIQAELEKLRNRITELEAENDSLTDEKYRLSGKIIGYEEEIKSQIQTSSFIDQLNQKD